MLPFTRPQSATSAPRRRRPRPLTMLLALLLGGMGLVGGSILTNHDAWRRALPARLGGSGAQAGAETGAETGAEARAGAAGRTGAAARSGTGAEKSEGAGSSSSSSLVNRLITSTPTSAQPTVALTFDDGPHPVWTPKLLEVLRRHQVKAVFCVLGENAAARPDLIRQVAAAGHMLCNHSYTHDFELGARRLPQIHDEVERTNQVIRAAAPGVPIPWYRAPGGYWAESVWQVTTARDMGSLWWAQDPRDWDGPSENLIVQRVIEHLHPGSVILLHDGGGNRAATVAAVDRLIPTIRALGYQFAMPATTPPVPAQQSDADKL